VSAGGPWQIFSEAPTPNNVRTAYRMSRTEFLNYWNGQAVYRER
jgi:hypothetical protein